MAHRPTPDRAAARRNTNEPRPPVQPNEPERRAAAGPERLEFLVHDRPNEPERRSVSVPEGLEFLLPDRPAPGALHEPAAAWTPNEPENLRPGDDGAMAHAVRGASGGSSSR
jgi:hypothetical protein